MASTVTEMFRRRFGGKPKEDIYKDMICFEFEISQAATYPVTANHNNAPTYLDVVVVDDSEITFGRNTTYTFSAGKHKIGWRMKDVTSVQQSVIPTIAIANDTNFTTKVVIIPSCLQSMANYAMRSQPAYRITKAYVYPTTPPTLGTAAIELWYARPVSPIYVPDNSIALYQSAPQWSAYSNAYKPLSQLTQ